MELYLVRHGVAAERGPQYPDDTQRPLTPEGIESLRREARALDVLEVSFDLIISSPLLRTRQTAEVLADGMRDHPRIVFSDALAPSGSAAAVVEEVAKHAADRKIALVGHEPGIGELAAKLVGARAPFEFKKGAICRIDFAADPAKAHGSVRWFVPPKLLKRIG